LKKKIYNNITIIVAGGVGDRVDRSIPKQYLSIRHSTTLRICVEKFLKHKEIDAVIVVIHKDHVFLYEEAVKGLDVLPYVFGGERRQDSVRHALEEIQKYKPKNILIHDAARIFFEEESISALLEKLTMYKGAILAVPVSDTVKYYEYNKIKKTVPRNNLFLAQTPQAFCFKTISSLHQKYKNEDVTDDAAICEIDGLDIAIIDSSILNFKITNAKDFELAKRLIEYEYERKS
jgi:2-C-methyl-D-erythritol 4-phosphate cytidylyltransferase/2-C-methyl-D-erythritol 2,4-cyclodiphosphate synthase